MIGTRLQKIEPGYNKGQDTITLNWGSHWQTKRGKKLQQIRLDLEIQQCTNKRRRWI